MNVLNAFFFAPRPANARPVAQPVAAAPARRDARRRDLGVGYGNSSGYASGRRYAASSVSSRFRVF